jgi:hypothetical protein
MPGSNKYGVRSRQCQQAGELERESSRTDRLTSTFTRVGDDLLLRCSRSSAAFPSRPGAGEVLQMSGERGGANEGEGWLPEGFPRYINRRRGLGLGWVALDAIGRRGRRLRTVRWSESRGLVGGVGGWPVWLQWRRFQRSSEQNIVRRGRLGAPRG